MTARAGSCRAAIGPIHGPMRRISFLCALVIVAAARPASPTTVVAPTFDELVMRAESVIVARVAAIPSETPAVATPVRRAGPPLRGVVSGLAAIAAVIALAVVAIVLRPAV